MPSQIHHQMPSLLPPTHNMAYYSSRPMAHVPTTADYYTGMTTTAPHHPMTTATAYEPYAVAPLTLQPPTHPSHHSHHSSTSSYLSNDPHSRITPSSLPAQHRASSGAWNQQDDMTLVGARAKGENWAQIQQNYFPTKTPNACRKRHERLMERRGADDWDNRKMERIAKEYMALRKEIWAPLAQRTGEKWNVVEQKCMSNGLKNLQGAARAAARRERAEAGLPPADPYNDDSGISGIDLTPVDDMSSEDPYGAAPSPDRRSTSSYSTNAYQTPYPGYPSMAGSGQGGHTYSSSSSSTAGYGHHSSQSASPYLDPVHRMPSVDMGIEAIINRGPGQAGV